MHTVRVRHVEQSFLQEASRSVRNHAITFHLSETQTSVARSTFCRLPRQDLSRSSATRVDLVTHHVLKPLIESRTQEDHNLESLACKTVVHDLISVSLVTELVELAGNIAYSLSLERRCVAFISVESSNLAKDTFDQVADRHAGRNSVRVHDHVGVNTLDGERQILLSIGHAASSFLAVTARELVANLRNFDRAHLNFNHALLFFV